MIRKEVEYSDMDTDIIKIKIGSNKRKNVYKVYLASTKLRLDRVGKALESMENSGFEFEFSYPKKMFNIVLSK